MKKTCNKWNVSYLDFFEGSTTYNGVTYAVGELDEKATVVNLNRVEGDGQYHYGWHSDNITLTSKTKKNIYIFKNGEGVEKFTDEQIALLPAYIEIK